MASRGPTADAGRGARSWWTPPGARWASCSRGSGSLSGEVEIRVGEVAAQVRVWGHRITTGTATVAFESNDCTGPPLLVVLPGALPSPPLFRLTGVGPGEVLMVDAGPVATLPIGSTYRSNQAIPGCGGPLNPAEDVVPAAPLLDLSVFTQPFAVR